MVRTNPFDQRQQGGHVFQKPPAVSPAAYAGWWVVRVYFPVKRPIPSGL